MCIWWHLQKLKSEGCRLVFDWSIHHVDVVFVSGIRDTNRDQPTEIETYIEKDDTEHTLLSHD